MFRPNKEIKKVRDRDKEIERITIAIQREKNSDEVVTMRHIRDLWMSVEISFREVLEGPRLTKRERIFCCGRGGRDSQNECAVFVC